MKDSPLWPPLPYDEWKDTCTTLHMWTQIVGKVKLELAPFVNEWWNVAFYLTARGMTTGLVPYRDLAFQIDFDFIDHKLSIQTDDGAMEVLPLVPRTVADFYGDIMDRLHKLGIEVTINPIPTEVPDPIPCDVNRVNSAYDPDAVNRWWRIQVQSEKVLQHFRSPFVGKSSPIQFFWGSFDLSHTRFSGRPAPKPQGGHDFFQSAEDQENIAFGFWPGNPGESGVTLGEPAYYSYMYPAPEGYRDIHVRPDAAHFDNTLGELILPYEALRHTQSPEDNLLAFFQSAYEAAATLAGWDREALEQRLPHGAHA